MDRSPNLARGRWPLRAKPAWSRDIAFGFGGPRGASSLRSLHGLKNCRSVSTGALRHRALARPSGQSARGRPEIQSRLCPQRRAVLVLPLWTASPRPSGRLLAASAARLRVAAVRWAVGSPSGGLCRRFAAPSGRRRATGRAGVLAARDRPAGAQMTAPWAKLAADRAELSAGAAVCRSRRQARTRVRGGLQLSCLRHRCQ